jgi:hypothetical protein
MLKVLQIWLDHQCRMLTGCIHAVLLFGPLDQGPFNQALLWPEDRHYRDILFRTAKVVLRNKRTVVKTINNQGENTNEPLDVLACPLFFEGQLLGGVAIAITHRSLSMQRSAVQEVHTGAKWLEALIELQHEPTLVTKKRDKQPFKKKIFEPVQSILVKLFGPRRLPLKVGISLISVFLLLGFFLVSTRLRIPSDSKSDGISRHAVVVPQQGNITKAQTDYGNSTGDAEGVVTLGEQEPPIEEQKPQSQSAQLPQEQSKLPTDSKHSKFPVCPTESEEKTSSVTSTQISDQKSSGTKNYRVLNSESETITTNSIEELYSIEIGPIIREKELKEAIRILQNNGFDCQQALGMGTVKVTRLLEGLYTRDIAHKRYKEIQSHVDSPFIILEKGKLAIYVATYHNQNNAIQKLKQLAQKNIKVKMVSTEIEMKGKILVVKRVNRPDIETISDQMSRMGLSFKVIEPR